MVVLEQAELETEVSATDTSDGLHCLLIVDLIVRVEKSRNY